MGELPELSPLISDQSDRQSSPLPPDIGDRLGELSDRLEQLENSQGLDENDLERLAAILTRDYLGDRLEKIEKHLDWAKREILDQRQKIKGLESDAYWYQGDKPETAIMIQKQPIPAADLPPTPTEITLTHQQVADYLHKTVATVKKWAKDPNKWPEGWLYDSDKNYWTKQD